MQAYIGNIKIDLKHKKDWKQNYEQGSTEIGLRFSKFFGRGPVRGLKISAGPDSGRSVF